MIKVFVHISKAIVGFVAALLFASCNFGGKSVDGSGNITTQTRTVSGDYTIVSAATGLEVYVVQGNKPSIVVEADDNLQQYIKTEVEGNELRIYADVSINKAGAKRVTVTLPKIEGLEASSASILKSKTVIKGDDIVFSANSGASVEVGVDAKTVNCEASSNGTLKVSGRTTDLNTISSSGASVNAAGLTAEDAKSEASSGGSATVNVTGKLDAEASSGGSISYSNNPKTIKSNATSGGSVSKQ